MFGNILPSAPQKLYVYTALKQDWKERCYDPANNECDQTPGHHVERSTTEDSSVEEQNG